MCRYSHMLRAGHVPRHQPRKAAEVLKTATTTTPSLLTIWKCCDMCVLRERRETLGRLVLPESEAPRWVDTSFILLCIRQLHGKDNSAMEIWQNLNNSEVAIFPTSSAKGLLPLCSGQLQITKSQPRSSFSTCRVNDFVFDELTNLFTLRLLVPFSSRLEIGLFPRSLSRLTGRTQGFYIKTAIQVALAQEVEWVVQQLEGQRFRYPAPSQPLLFWISLYWIIVWYVLLMLVFRGRVTQKTQFSDSDAKVQLVSVYPCCLARKFDSCWKAALCLLTRASLQIGDQSQKRDDDNV